MSPLPSGFAARSLWATMDYQGRQWGAEKMRIGTSASSELLAHSAGCVGSYILELRSKKLHISAATILHAKLPRLLLR